jgi:hypothetical protein
VIRRGGATAGKREIRSTDTPKCSMEGHPVLRDYCDIIRMEREDVEKAGVDGFMSRSKMPVGRCICGIGL